jgi:Zn-dependent protease
MSNPQPEEPQGWAQPPPQVPGGTPPPAGPGGYQPFQDYYQQANGAAAPRQQQQRRSGIFGGLMSILLAVWAFIKYGGLFLLKFGFAKTLITLLISFGLYAWALGPIAGLGIVVMILIHEMGHVVEIRRQGMQATAPLFIPFMGAAIFQRSHPRDALHQAYIGIAGPIAGTVASIVAQVLYSVTGWTFLLAWAWFGFFVNLFNMIPFGMLDGGWVLAAASKWFQVAGIVLLGAALLFFHLVFSPILIVLLLFGIPAAIQRFRNDKLPYYQSVPTQARIVMGLSWLGLVAILGYGMMQTAQLIAPLQ